MGYINITISTKAHIQYISSVILESVPQWGNEENY